MDICISHVCIAPGSIEGTQNWGQSCYLTDVAQSSGITTAFEPLCTRTVRWAHVWQDYSRPILLYNSLFFLSQKAVALSRWRNRNCLNYHGSNNILPSIIFMCLVLSKLSWPDIVEIFKRLFGKFWGFFFNFSKWPTWRTIFYFIIRLLQSSTCFEQCSARHQEVKLY